MKIRLLLCAVLLDAAAAAASGGIQATRSPTDLLLDQGRLSPLQLDAVNRGRVVAKVMETDDRSEVLTFAAMRVRTTPARVLQRFRGVEAWARDPWVLQVGRVGHAPAVGDLDALRLDPADLKALSRCRANDCDVRLPAEAIEQFQRQIDWSSPGRDAESAALFRETLASYTASYLSLGNAALFEYANNDEPVRIEDSLSELIRRSRFLADASPVLYDYLHRFPHDRPPSTEDFVYWQKERFWRLNVLSLNHAILADRAAASGRVILAVSKQLYASHYFESCLALTAYVESSAGDAYLIGVTRARADIRRSGFNWVERLLLNHLVQRRVEGQFGYLKRWLEES